MSVSDVDKIFFILSYYYEYKMIYNKKNRLPYL